MDIRPIIKPLSIAILAVVLGQSLLVMENKANSECLIEYC